MIRIEGLQKYYNRGRKNEEHVLKGISLTLGETGLVCLLGESGCGKTTLLNTVGGLDEFSGGSISIDDVTVTKYDPKKIEPVRNDRFGYIFQNYYLLQDETVAYNVKLALSRFRLTEEEKDSRVEYVLKLLGMEKYRKKPVSKLSGGQQQRVSIARALIKSPDIILADEPTGNLDEENTLRTMSILKSISKSCLVLLVTHERRIAQFFADRIIEISDGEIIRDEDNRGTDAYERAEDANLYLKEMECQTVQTEYARFRVYCGKGEILPPVRLNLAWRDGKLYIQKDMDCDLILEGVESGVQMLDTERPKFDAQEMDKISYELERPAGGGKSALAPREIWRMARQNLALLGRKQRFMVVIMLATAVLLSVVTAQYANAKLVDSGDFVSSDDHYLSVEFTKVSSIRSDEQQLQILEYVRTYLSDGSLGTISYVPSTSLYLLGEGFEQMKHMMQSLTGFSYARLSLVDEEALVYGVMPETRNEVLVDKTVAQRWLESDGVLSSSYESVQDFVGVELFANAGGQYITIAGICDTGEPDIYASESMLISMGKGGYNVMSATELAAEDASLATELAKDEVLVREGLLAAMTDWTVGGDFSIGEEDDKTYTIAGTFSDEIDADYVFSEEGLAQVTEYVVYAVNKSCLLYNTAGTDFDEMIEKLTAYGETYHAAFTITASVPYEEELAAYWEAKNVDVDAKTLIAVLITLISFIMIYFMMKSNAVSRSEELTVYRLIGISKGSILKAYALEMVLITTMTSLPGVAVTCGVMKYISAIPSLKMDLTFPVWCAVLLLLALYVLHAAISVLPVLGILAKPPAALAVKESI